VITLILCALGLTAATVIMHGAGTAVGVLMLGWSTGILVAVIGAAYRGQLSAPKSAETQ
jgi:tellurite resistance protein TehA-like permease